ncbi:MAG: hypothetical protein GTN99_02905 [Candidatus Dadabacteria bacterium]|nr:hypothetical protein [Candidatus Dadabacteria bacterium]
MAIQTNEMDHAEWFRDHEIKAALKEHDWKNSAMVAHHCHFDGLIMSHHYDIVPAFYMCTLSMARPIHGGEISNALTDVSIHYGSRGKKPGVLERTKNILNLPDNLMEDLGIYCGQDVEEMMFVFSKLRPKIPDDEMRLIHYTIRAYADPVLELNRDLAEEVHLDEIGKKQALLNELGITDKKQLTSREKFADRLRALGVEPPLKTSPRTGNKTYAFAKNDLEFQKLEQYYDERVRKLVEARLIVSTSIEETRSKRLISHSTDGPLPIYLSYGKAHTLRWAGGDKMNPQNFGRKSSLRECIVAPEGHKLVIVDSSQIEARMNAWLAGEEELVEAFRDERDIYKQFAAEEVYLCPIEEITADQRFVGKVCILGLGYQMGGPKFKYTLNVGSMGPKVFFDEDSKYHDVVRRYRNRYSNIRKQWYTMQDMIYCMAMDKECKYGPLTFRHNEVSLPNDMYLRYPNLKAKWDAYRQEYYDWTYNEKTKIYGGLLTENIIQALARIVVAYQALSVADLYRIVLLVHDEVVLCVPEELAEQALKDTMKAFCVPPEWAPDLPVKGEGAISTFYTKP